MIGLIALGLDLTGTPTPSGLTSVVARLHRIHDLSHGRRLDDQFFVLESREELLQVPVEFHARHRGEW